MDHFAKIKMVIPTLRWWNKSTVFALVMWFSQTSVCFLGHSKATSLSLSLCGAKKEDTNVKKIHV